MVGFYQSSKPMQMLDWAEMGRFAVVSIEQGEQSILGKAMIQHSADDWTGPKHLLRRSNH